VSEETKRIEVIRGRLNEARAEGIDHFQPGKRALVEDAKYLLKRVVELESDNGRLRTFIQKVDEVDFGFLHYIEHLLGEDYSEFYRSWEVEGERGL
jgi:hypothetical protein